MSSQPVAVKIYRETYTLRTAEDPALVEEVARYVDARMREVAASGKVVETSKIAVLAALHIADELLRLRREAAPASAGAERRLRALAARIDAALAEG